MKLRSVLLALAALIVTAGIVLGIVAAKVDSFRPKIQAELQSKLNRPVAIGHLGLRLLPLSIKVDGLSISEAPEFGASRPFAKAGEVFVSASLFSLLAGNPQVKDVVLQHPQIELIRNAAGNWNFASLGGKGSSGGNNAFSLDKLKISDGQAGYTDLQHQQARAVYDHIDLTLTEFAANKAFGVELGVHLPGDDKQTLTFKGKVSTDATFNKLQVSASTVTLGANIFNISGNLDNSLNPANLNVQISTKDASIGDLAKLAGGSGSGKLSLDVHAQGPTSDPSKLIFSGTASIAAATWNAPQLTKPLTITSAQAQFSQNSVTLTNLSAGLGSSTLQGSASVQNFSAPAVQFALSVNKIDTDELQHLTATSPSRPDGNGSLLNTVTGSGKLTVGSIKAQDILLGNVSAAIQLNHGQITLSPLSAGAFGGSVSGAITADMRPATPLCSAKTKLAGIDANALLSAVSSMKNQLYGSLSGTTDLSFALASSADLPRTLNGTLAFSLAKGEIKNVNIMGELAKAGKLLGNTSLANAGSSTALKELDGTLTFANGLATTNNLRAALDSGSLTASGSVNLVNQDLNMHVTATLAGQTAGGGILGAVLANNKGELVVPVIVTGNTAHMTFTPDVEAMAKQRLGGILGQKQNPDAKQQNPINSILNQFLKKKL